VAASQADPDVLRGLRCPAWAHIRKVNPRDLGTDKGDESKTIGMQMLRRGIPFGPLYDRERPGAPENAAERGLLFVAYQRHLDKQFAALTKDWMNKPNAPTAGGFDLLVGQHINGGLHAPKSATFHTPDGPGIAFKAERQWVIPTGGAFLFAPSLRFIEYFVHASAPGAAPSFGALAK
jgi:deferrochelatase/peroxidase EfeB